MIVAVERSDGLELSSAHPRDCENREQNDCKEDCQFGIAVDSGQHAPDLLKGFHSAFPFPERDELGDSVGSTGIRPAGDLCSHFHSRVLNFPLAVFPYDHRARFIESLLERDAETLIETVLNEVIETGGEYILPPDRHAENALWAIRLHDVLAIGVSELDAVCKWRTAAVAAHLAVRQLTSPAWSQPMAAEA